MRRFSISKVPKALIKSFKAQTGFISFNNEDMADKTNEEKIEHRLKTLSFDVKVAHTISGYSCNIYLLDVGIGQKVGSIFRYKMDIASALDVSSIRIAEKLVKYEGKSYLSIEVNKHPDERSVLTLDQSGIPSGTKFALGRDNYNKEIIWDIGNHSTPHLLVAGATGSGKSVAIKTIIDQAFSKGYDVTIIDPKYEFKEYGGKCKVTSDQKEIEAIMSQKVAEMDSMYKAGIDHASKKQMIIFDEGSDCFTRQSRPDRGEKFKTLEENTLLLAQKARAAGIHLVLSSQRWSVKILTGDVKANFATRLCLTVASETDSKVMLDEVGAEDLNGRGDALYRSPDTGESIRIQCYIMK
jgi:DNA segregation ATPase FtsK/SpoIIIE-like protein